MLQQRDTSSHLYGTGKLSHPPEGYETNIIFVANIGGVNLSKKTLIVSPVCQ